MKKLVSGFVSLGIIFSGAVSPVYAFDAFCVSDQAISTVPSTEDNIDGGITNSQYETKFDNVVNKIYELRKKGKSFEEIDKNLDNIIEKESNKLISFVSYSPSDKFYEYANLNSQEKKLFNSNKAKGLLCLANGKFAIKYTRELYKNEKKVMHNGNGDAFRHTLWNYGMAIDVGQSFAKKWSDAHENGAKGQPKIEKQMDVFNNKVGLNLAKENPHTILHSTFKSKTRAKVRAGKCRIIKNGKLVKSSKAGEK